MRSSASRVKPRVDLRRDSMPWLLYSFASATVSARCAAYRRRGWATRSPRACPTARSNRSRRSRCNPDTSSSPSVPIRDSSFRRDRWPAAAPAAQTHERRASCATSKWRRAPAPAARTPRPCELISRIAESLEVAPVSRPAPKSRRRKASGSRRARHRGAKAYRARRPQR